MKYQEIPRDKIIVEGYRLRFQSGIEEIDELAHSIEVNGLICPVPVTRTGDNFRLIAGYRRLRAMDKLGWKKIPTVIFAEEGEADILVKGVVENLIRLDLSPLERAKAFQEIVEKYGYTQEMLAGKLGRRKAYISQHIRLLDKVHPKVLQYLHKGNITFGHARALLRLKDQKKQLEIAEMIIEKELNVKDTELVVDQARPGEELTDREKNLNAMENDIRKAVGPKWWQGITIRQGKKRERLIINFSQRPGLKEMLHRIADAL